MTLIFDKAQKELLQVQIASYMDDPKDATEPHRSVQQAAEWPEPRRQPGDRRGQQAAGRRHAKLKLPAPLSFAFPWFNQSQFAKVATDFRGMKGKPRLPVRS
jgi:hypothetical protein